MIKDKEYPATHSMWTAWFAIDEDGNVAIMECDDNGPAPLNAPKEETSDELILETLTNPKTRIKYTDDQLTLLMGNSISPKEYARDDYDYENMFGDLCEINQKKLDLIKEAASSNPNNRLICVSETLNLWYISFSLPHYLDNSGDSRYMPTKKKIEENNHSKTLYKRIFDEEALVRIVNFSWPLGYDEEDEYGIGCIKKTDSPLALYFQGYDYRAPAKRMHILSECVSVKEGQLSESLRANALRLPLRFKDHKSIQIAQHAASNFYGNNDDWMVDGKCARIVKLPDDSYCFVGNGCFFEPIPLDEAFAAHDTKFSPYSKDYAHEYKINGKRGYVRYGDGPYRIAGSLEEYETNDSDVIVRIENDND